MGNRVFKKQWTDYGGIKIIDIIEAGKFYLECLKKVHESILKENVLPENTVLNSRVDLVCYNGPLDKRLIGAFDLNGVTHTFEISVARNDSIRDIVCNASLRIGNVIADAVVKQTDWDSLTDENSNSTKS